MTQRVFPVIDEALDLIADRCRLGCAPYLEAESVDDLFALREGVKKVHEVSLEILDQIENRLQQKLLANG